MQKIKYIYINIVSDKDTQMGSTYCSPEFRKPRDENSKFKEQEKDQIKWFENQLKSSKEFFDGL